MRHFQLRAGRITTVRYGPDGQSLYVIAIGSDGMSVEHQLLEHAYHLDLRSSSVVNHETLGGSSVADFTPDFRSVYYSISVVTGGGELDLFQTRLATLKEERVFSANVPYPGCLAFTPNGHLLAVGGWHYFGDGEDYVHILDVWHRTEVAVFPLPHVTSVAYSPNGQTLAAGSGKEGVVTWQNRRITQQWPEPATCLTWSRDGQVVWAGGEQLTVAWPNRDDHKHVWPIAGQTIKSLAVSPDCATVLLGAQEGNCSFIEVSTGRILSSFDWGIGPVTAVAFSPDGLTCAVGGENGQVVVWDVDH